MTGGTRAPALSQHGHVCPLGEAPGRGGGSPGSRDTGRSGFLGPPLRRDPAPSGILTFRGVAKPRGARGAHSLRAARARLRNALLWASPEGPSRPLPGLHAPGAARAAAVVFVADAGCPLPMGWFRGLPAGGRELVPSPALCSARWLSLSPGAAGAL